MIVGSILLAFGIDAYWSERQERAEERAVIAQLTAEMRSNAARFDTVRTHHEEALRAAREILARGGLGGEPRGVLPMPELMGRLVTNWTYDPTLGGINSLISSGNLGILRSEELRVALAGWPDIVEDLNEDELLQREVVVDYVFPHLIGAGLLSAFGSSSAMNGLLDDPRFLQIVSWRAGGLQCCLLEEVESTDQSIQELLALLEGR